MAYQDPYAGRYAGQQYGQHYPQQPAYGQYNDPDEYNPYAGAQQPHATYEHGGYDGYNYGGGYRDDPVPEQTGYRDAHRQGSYMDSAPPPAFKSIDETSRFDPGEFAPSPRGPKTASNLREYRREFQGNLWTRGGRGSCICRFFCCIFTSVVFLVAVIILALVLWLRPPSIDIGTVAPMTSGSTIQPTSDGVIINMGVNISVYNPNYFNVNFKKITADIIYPINNTAIGNGTASNIVLKSNQETNFTFPFIIDYSTAIDPDDQILLDLAKKCGILGTKTDLTVNYKITLGLQILFVTISPSVSNTFSFECPLDASDLDGLLNGVNPS